MKHLNLRQLPVIATLGVLALVWFIQWLEVRSPDSTFFRTLEGIFFDMRVRIANRFPHPGATNLAAVFIDEETLNLLESNDLGYRAKPPLPRHVHGRLIRELRAEGAKIVALDIMVDKQFMTDAPLAMAVSDARANGFSESELAANSNRFPYEVVGNDGRTNTVPGLTVESDEFFAVQMRRSSNVVLAAQLAQGLLPNSQFRTNALAMGDIATEQDADGKLRRLHAFRDSRQWHPAIEDLLENQGFRLGSARVESNRCVFAGLSTNNFVLRLDEQGRFQYRDLPKCPTNWFHRPPVKAFEMVRAWHMGIVMAAHELGLDLSKSEWDKEKQRVVLRGPKGVERVIPVDAKGRFLIDWSYTWDDPRLLHVSYGLLLQMDYLRNSPKPDDVQVAYDALREAGQKWTGQTPFEGKVVVVGSRVIGSNMSDVGATPLGPQTYFVSAHWNVADSVLSGRFIRQSSPLTRYALIMAMTAFSALVTWKWRVIWATAAVIIAGAVYFGIAALVYTAARYDLPIALPVIGGLGITHVGLVTCRVVVEQRERRRVRSVFAKLVSPNVVSELLGTEHLALGGARRKITVYFADVRGFTEMTDVSQVRAEEYAREKGLTGAEADKYYDEQAREVLATVNLYLSIIADMVKKHDGTLDKYIGDCVMAFWGAPTPNDKHALYCVRAAMDAQRAMAEVNVKRQEENQRREKENPERIAAGLAPLLPLPVLSLGSGINTGVVTVGLMGSADHIFNYTVFGREVNLASRLEGVSGRGRVIVSEATYRALQRDDPALAATCVEQPPVMVKGIRQAVKIYEVPWKTVPVATVSTTPTPTASADGGAKAPEKPTA